MDVGALCSRLGVKDQVVVRKAQELQRILGIKTSQRSTNTTQNVCIVDLACRTLNVTPPDAAQLQKYSSCAKPAAYAVALGAVSQVLGMTVHLVSLRQLCVQHGCMHIAQQCEEAFTRYQQLNAAQQKPVYERPVYPLTMFCLIAKKMKCTVDRVKLRDQYGVKEVEFKAVTQSMIDTCPGLVCTEAQKRARSKKLKSDDSRLEHDESVQGEYMTAQDMSENPHLANTKLASNTQWKEDVLKSIEAENKTNTSRKRKTTSQSSDNEDQNDDHKDEYADSNIVNSKPVPSTKRQRPIPSWDTHDTIVL